MEDLFLHYSCRISETNNIYFCLIINASFTINPKTIVPIIYINDTDREFYKYQFEYFKNKTEKIYI